MQDDKRESIVITVSYCAVCDLRSYDGPPLCFSCGAATDVRQEDIRELTVYASTTMYVGPDGQPHTIAYVDAGKDLRFLADVDGPVEIGAKGYLTLTEVERGLQRFTFHAQDATKAEVTL